MNKITLSLIVLLCSGYCQLFAQNKVLAQTILPGVWKYSYGTPDSITPLNVRPKHIKAKVPVHKNFMNRNFYRFCFLYTAYK